MANRELAPQFALRSDDGVEVGILGGDIVVRRAGWLARTLREPRPRWLQEVLLVAERRLAVALATAHYTGGVRSVSLHNTARRQLDEPRHFLRRSCFATGRAFVMS